MKVCGVDVGYGNVKYCAGDKDAGLVYGHFPAIAKAATSPNRGGDVFSRLDLVSVESGGGSYLVGNDAADTLSARDERGGHLMDCYVNTPQYLALLRGALAYSGCANIDLLVSGLPVDHYSRDKDRLKGLLVGTHNYPDGSSVIVKDAWVVPQPAGGFIEYFMSNSANDDINGIKSLTIDVGYYTIDWLVCRGLKMQQERCGSTAGGMSLVLEKLAQLISADRGARSLDLDIVDEGVRRGFVARIQGQDYDFSHLVPDMERQIAAAVQPVARSVGVLDDIDVVVLVGGGAACYKRVIEALLARAVVMPDGGVYCNVKGFFRAGEKRLSAAHGRRA